MVRARNTWKLQDAKAHFSEVVRRARTEGPQMVTLRGKEAVVVLSVEDAAERTPGSGLSLVEFLQSSSLGLVTLERDEDRGRDVDL